MIRIRIKLPDNGVFAQRSGIILAICLAVALVVVAAGVWGYLRLTQEPQGPVVSVAHQAIKFASYTLRPSSCTPALAEYQLSPRELGNLENFQKTLQQEFTQPQLQDLAAHHFFITTNADRFYGDDPNEPAGRTDDWTYLYGQIGGPFSPANRRPDNAVFVSSDFLLHLYHRLLDKEFEYLEQRSFYPRLARISDVLLDASLEGYQQAGTPAQKESFSRLIAFFVVPSVILDAVHDYAQQDKISDEPADSANRVLRNLTELRRLPPTVYETARQELELLLAAKQAAPSPLLGRYARAPGLVFMEDYTQYSPRGHYRKNPVLRAYFRAMMWYGRRNFLLSSSQLTRDAANITRLMDKAGLLKEWEDIYLPTAFFIGESDDLGFYEYHQALEQSGATAELSEKSVSALQRVLKNYRNPQVFSKAAFGKGVFSLSKEELQAQSKGFRLMGQRFTPDAFIFSFLTQGDEKPDPATGERLPGRPTALMVMSLLGSRTAAPLLAQWMDEQAPASKKVLSLRLQKLNRYLNELPPEDWTQNIYWSWLYSLRALFDEGKDKSGYPGFMKSQAWGRKNLQCALGSWTELKHDALLYAKQSYAEMGNGAEEEQPRPVPLGYVEPNIEFLDRLLALIIMTREGLEQRRLLDNDFRQRHDDLEKAVDFFRRIAIAQLQDEEISEADFEKLRLTPGNLGYILLPLPGEEGTENQARSALIADVYTDFRNQEILYEATGIPNYLYVAVKDKNGARLTKGLSYSYYEFTAPLGQRLNDETWREWNYTPDKSRLPAMPEWNRSLIR